MSDVRRPVISLSTVVFLCFFIAKITGAINWSWLLVLSPLWLPLAFVVCILSLTAMVFVIGALMGAGAYIKNKRKKVKK